MKTLRLSTAAAVVITALSLGSSAWGADYTISDPSPLLLFNDTDYPDPYEWTIGTATHPDGDHSFWAVYDGMDNTHPIVIWSSLTTNNNLFSLVVNSLGDVSLANGGLFVDRSMNRVGIGTTVPWADLHVHGGGDIQLSDSYQAWRLDARGFSSGDNSYFGLIDVTNKNKIPFVAYEKNPNFTMVLRNGSTGLGTNTPTAKLDVNGDIKSNNTITSTWSGSNTEGDGLTNLLVLSADNSEADLESDAGFALRNEREGTQWNFRTHQNGNAFVATIAGTGGPEFTVKNATGNYKNMELHLGNGAKNVGGVWIDASSRALKENIKDLSTQDALAAFHQLQPVTYNYKSDKKEQVVGFIAEDVPELVAIQSRDGLSSMDMVAVLTKVVQEQEKTLTETKAELKVKDKKMVEMEAKIAKLEAIQKRLAKVESLLTNLALDTSNTKKEKVSLNLKK